MERERPQALAELQEQLRRLITEPEGVEAALASQGAPPLAALVRAERGPAPVVRLAVYANAYFARIHDCLREDFPALAKALGPAAFHDLVKTYLMAHPPARPSLRHAGAHLAEHLSTEPFRGIFARRCPYAADLARLEWAISEAFYAADGPVLTRAELAAVPHARWGELRFEGVPSLALVACAWPVERVRRRADAEDPEEPWHEAPGLASAPTWLRVFRQGDDVRYRAVCELEFAALGALREGLSFAAVCERLACAVGEAQAASQAASFVAAWIADGVLARA